MRGNGHNGYNTGPGYISILSKKFDLTGSLGITSTLTTNTMGSSTILASNIQTNTLLSSNIQITTLVTSTIQTDNVDSIIILTSSIKTKDFGTSLINIGPYNMSKTLWVAVGEYVAVLRNAIKYSSDGSNWYNAESGGFYCGFGVAYGNDLWVACGTGAAVDNAGVQNTSNIQYSSNASNWYNAHSPGFDRWVYGIAYGNGLWVAVGNASSSISPLSTIQYSSNASNWYLIKSGGFFDGQGYASYGYSVAYNNGLWVAVGSGNYNNVGVSNTIQYSSNASNWYSVNTGGFFNSGLNYMGGFGVAYGNGLWVAVGTTYIKPTSTIQYSSDGSNWKSVKTGGFTYGGFGVAYGNGLWVAVGNASSAASSIQYSSDGSNWKGANTGGFTSNSYNLENRGQRVSFANGLWVAVGGINAGITYSSDGSNWSNIITGGFSGLEYAYGVANSTKITSNLNVNIAIINNQLSLTYANYNLNFTPKLMKALIAMS
jgi:hypothetical protein